MRLLVIAILVFASLALSPSPSGGGRGQGEGSEFSVAVVAQVSEAEKSPHPDPLPGGEGTRFAVVDVFVDSGNAPLAAYQLELTDAAGVARIVGVEGGEPSGGPFRAAPYFDPKAIQRDRVILAAFSTASNGALPKGKVRVATVHVRLTGEPRWQTKLVAAADASGEAIAAEVRIESGN